MRAGKRDSLGVGNHINGANGIECCSHIGDSFGDHFEFTARSASESSASSWLNRAAERGVDSAQFMRMFGPHGNPQARNLFEIIGCLQQREGCT